MKIEQHGQGRLSKRASAQAEVERVSNVRNFGYLEKPRTAVARIDPDVCHIALFVIGERACKVMSKPPTTEAIDEFAFRIVEEYPAYSLEDVQLFYRKFTGGYFKVKINFAGPGLAEMLECWEWFLSERAGEFEKLHDQRKKSDDLDDYRDILEHMKSMVPKKEEKREPYRIRIKKDS